jgi:hypothetical protein
VDIVSFLIQTTILTRLADQLQWHSGQNYEYLSARKNLNHAMSHLDGCPFNPALRAFDFIGAGRFGGPIETSRWIQSRIDL